MTSNISTPYKNKFTAQVIVSGLPTSIIITFLPIFLDFLQLDISVLGLIYMGIRINSVVGGFLTPHLLKKLPPHLISSGAEILNFIIIMISLIALLYRSPILFIPFIILKGLTIGIINTTRFTWLKNLSNAQLSQKIFTLTNSIYQSTYALAGFLFISFNNIYFGAVVLAFDAITSLIGCYLFYKSDEHQIKIKANTTKKNFTLLFRGKFKFLTMIDIFYNTALGGINILLVKYGGIYLEEYGGYGLALILYGAMYFLGGLILNNSKRPNFYNTLLESNILLFGFSIGFLLLSLGGSIDFISLIGLSLIFFLLPIFSLAIQLKWFEIAPKESSAHIFATRTFVIQFILACGEGAYGFISNDINYRLFLILLLFVLTPFLLKKVNLKRTIT